MQRRTLKVNEVAQTLGVSRTTIYKLIGKSDLERIKLGAATLIVTQSVDALLQRSAA